MASIFWRPIALAFLKRTSWLDSDPNGPLSLSVFAWGGYGVGSEVRLSPLNRVISLTRSAPADRAKAHGESSRTRLWNPCIVVAASNLQTSPINFCSCAKFLPSRVTNDDFLAQVDYDGLPQISFRADMYVRMFHLLLRVIDWSATRNNDKNSTLSNNSPC